MGRVKPRMKAKPETRWAVFFLHSTGWSASSMHFYLREAQREMRHAKEILPGFKYRIGHVRITEVPK